MSLALTKSVRDGGLTGGTSTLVTLLLIRQGVDPTTAAIVGVLAGTMAARVYRYARARVPWLAAFDPPGPENGTP